MKRTLITLMTIMLIAQIWLVKSEAVDTVGRENLNFDENLTDQETKYTLNSNILIAPIFFPSGEEINTDEWLQGLNYYSVERLGFSDIPFHYVVDSDGKIYSVNKTGDEAKIDLNGAEGSSIIVAYLAQEGDVDFTDKAKTGLNTILLQIANENSIEYTDIQIANLRFLVNKTTKIAQLEARDVTGTWLTSSKKMKDHVKANYSPIAKKYHVKVVEAKSPDGQLKPGEIAIVELKLKNTGEHALYADSDSMLLGTKKDGKLSKFFINGIWASQSQVAILSEGDVLRPDAEATYQLKFKVPLYFGAQKETFIIKDGVGHTIESTDFSVEINVGAITEKVIEILDTETGYLNVRASDSGNAKVIAKVSPGERYIQKKTSDNGFVQIDLGEGELGWVSQKYIKRIN